MNEPAWTRKVLYIGGALVVAIVALIFMLRSEVGPLVGFAGAIQSFLLPIYPALDAASSYLFPAVFLVVLIEKLVNFLKVGLADAPEPFFNVVAGMGVPLLALWLLLRIRA
jgi:hypothetical protein